MKVKHVFNICLLLGIYLVIISVIRGATVTPATWRVAEQNTTLQLMWTLKPVTFDVDLCRVNVMNNLDTDILYAYVNNNFCKIYPIDQYDYITSWLLYIGFLLIFSAAVILLVGYHIMKSRRQDMQFDNKIYDSLDIESNEPINDEVI